MTCYPKRAIKKYYYETSLDNSREDLFMAQDLEKNAMRLENEISEAIIESIMKRSRSAK